MKTLILLLLSCIMFVACAPKKVFYPDKKEYVDVHFIYKTTDSTLKIIHCGIKGNYCDTVLRGNLDFIIPLEKGTQPNFSFTVDPADYETPFIAGSVIINFGSRLAYSHGYSCKVITFGIYDYPILIF